MIVLLAFALLGASWGYVLTSTTWFAILSAILGVVFIWGCHSWEVP